MIFVAHHMIYGTYCSRFDRMVYLGISEDADSKIKILKAITRKFNLSPDVDLEVLATQCPVNLTGADLYALCSDAMLTALRKQVAELDKQRKLISGCNGHVFGICQSHTHCIHMHTHTHTHTLSLLRTLFGGPEAVVDTHVHIHIHTHTHTQIRVMRSGRVS